MLYICYINLDGRGFTGIKKKVLAQAKVLKKHFDKVFYTSYTGMFLKLYENEKEVDRKLAYSPQKLHFAISEWIEKYHLQNTYIRYAYPSNKIFLDFLKWQKGKKIRTIIEVPTYPYDGEITSGFVLHEDQYYRKFIKEYINKILVMSTDKKVFDIPAIQIFNGVDMDLNPLKIQKTHSEEIMLIAVSSLCMWHGLERMIEGMHLYYQQNPKRIVKLMIVGDGDERDFYQRLTDKYKLNDYISFSGLLAGTSLNQAFDQSDIAIGSLGLYKIGLDGCFPLKLGEYCARGIPFIYGYDDLRFQGNEEFLLRFPNDNTPIDITKIVSFKDQVDSLEDLAKHLRNMAEERFSWERVFQPVVDYFDNY